MGTTNSGEIPKKIIHIGIDFFYAAIEIRDDPSLQGSPVAVGGAPTKKGVISSANYEAREAGVLPGMESSRGRQLCPKLFIILPETKKYKKESKKIRAIFYRFTDLVEPLSLDETYLDVSDSDHFKGDSAQIASEIRRVIGLEFRLTASAGIANNKFLARAANAWKKPKDQFLITPDMVNEFLIKLPVEMIWEMGKEIADKMAALNLKTCGDLQKLSLDELNSHFESKGQQLYNLSRGIDDRLVVPSKEVKSFSLEETFYGTTQSIDESEVVEKQSDEKTSPAETPVSEEENEEAQRMTKIYQSVFESFKEAKVILIELGEKKYNCSLTKCKLGENMVFTVANPDTYLSMKVMDGDQAVFRLVTGTGKIVAFESKLLDKRVPKLTLTFPFKESKEFIRSNERTFTKMSAKIIVKSSENPMVSDDISAMGAINNLSDTGCSFTTNVNLEKHFKVYLAIIVAVKDAKKVFQIHGVIQRVKTIREDRTNYGIECDDGDKKILKAIRKVVETLK